MSPIAKNPMMLGGLIQVANAKDRTKNGEGSNPFLGQSGVSNPFQSNSRQILSQLAPFNFAVQA